MKQKFRSYFVSCFICWYIKSNLLFWFYLQLFLLHPVPIFFLGRGSLFSKTALKQVNTFCNLSQLWFAVYVLLAISHILKIKKLWQSFHMSMPSSKIPWLLSARCRLWGLLQTLLPSGGKRTLLGLSAHGKSHFIIHKPCFLSHVKYPTPLSHCLMDITIGFKISLLFLLLWSCG